MLAGLAAGYNSDICVSAPTGSGKTLAYALPVLEHRLIRALSGVVRFAVAASECNESPTGFGRWVVRSAPLASIFARSVAVDDARGRRELSGWLGAARRMWLGLRQGRQQRLPRMAMDAFGKAFLFPCVTPPSRWRAWRELLATDVVALLHGVGVAKLTS